MTTGDRYPASGKAYEAPAAQLDEQREEAEAWKGFYQRAIAVAMSALCDQFLGSGSRLGEILDKKRAIEDEVAAYEEEASDG